MKNLLSYKTNYVLILLLLSFSLTGIYSQQLAFPTAMGAGAYSTGGRGGEVVHVTNLNDSGEGSLRWALTDVSNRGNSRTIVFDVSGVIQLTSDIYMSNNGNPGNYAHGITIAGQTAPEGNITITGGKIFLVGIDDVVIRYVKFRSTANVSGCLQSQGGDNIIFDHLTGSHVEAAEVTFSMVSNNADEEGLTTGKTIQNCLIHDSGLGLILGDTSPPNDTHNEEHTIINNVFVNVGHRVPGKIGGAVRMDIINNVAHNWFARLIRLDDWSYTLNHVGNYYSKGGRNNERSNLAYYGTRNGKIYDSDNYIDPTANYPDWTDFDQPRIDQLPASSFVDTPFSFNNESTLNIRPSVNLKTEVVPFVGAYKYIDNNGTVVEDRDVLDTSAINKAITEFDGDTSQDITYSITLAEIPTSNNTRPTDFYQSNPHIPEAYLISRGITGNPTIHNQLQPSGYTLLEEYINQVDNTAPVPVVDVTGVDVTPETAEILIPNTIALTANIIPSNATDQSGIWESSDETIATVDANGVVTPVSVGEVTITFTSNDNPDLFDSSVITVFPEAFEANAGPDQTICQGESVVLSASGGTTYLWSNGDTTATIEVNPTVTTTYTVTVSDDLGNTDTDSVTVTVNELPIADAGNDQTVCEGDTITLTASGGTEYIWSTGETTASIQVAPSSDTLYTVEVISNGCTSTDDVTVFVNPSPNLTVSNNITIVEGDSVQLSVTGASNYEWSTGETTNIITVSPVETTTYTVTGTTGICSSQAQVTVTVEELLVVSAGQDENVCENDTYEVVLTASPGDSYLWSTGETTQSIVVSPLSTTTYSVTVASGIQEDTDDVTVFVNPNPDVVILNGESVDIMSGDFVTLSASGANTYEWNNGATQPNIAVSPSQTTTYEVRGYIGNCYDEKQVTVNVIPEVEADAGDDQDICLGDVVTLTATGGDEYVWSTGETTQSIQVSPTETTEYTVTVFNALDFDEDTVTVFVDNNCNDGVVVDNPVDGPALDFDFSVYPNPATEYVDIKLSGSDQLTGFYLYDLTGKLIFQKRVENENLSVSSTTRIDVSSLRPGIYLVKLADVQRELYKRLIVR
ncbi:MAG: Ig-like domain-containing protein [Winogradskyella sp.]